MVATSKKEKLLNVKRWVQKYAETLLFTKTNQKVIHHISEKHCGRSDEQLLERIYAEGLDSASSFYGTQEQTVNMLQKALMDKDILDQIAYFLVYAQPGIREELCLDFDHSIGCVMHKTGSVCEASTLVIVIEQASTDLSTAIRLVTAYCEEM